METANNVTDAKVLDDEEIFSEEPCSPTKKDNEKCSSSSKGEILFKATGNAPIMKKKRWKVELHRSVGWITCFLRKYLKLEPTDSLFLYVNQAFAPAPDQILKNLYECYAAEGTLVINYCKSQAWG